MSRVAVLLTTLVLAATGFAAAGPAGPAGATRPGCTAWSAMPSRVATTSRHTVVHLVLHGTAGCTSAAHDYGASATLHGPRGWHAEYQDWSRFGDTRTVDLYVTIERSGTYTMRDGDVQVYDSGEVRVPSSWRETTMTVRAASRFTKVRIASAASATVSHYTEFGWRASSGVPVALQQQSGSQWRTVARGHASSTGRVLLGHGLSSAHRYRLVSASSAAAWGATSPVR